MCDAIYIDNTQQTIKKRIDGHFSDLLRLLKNGQKSGSFAAHFEQHFNYTTPGTYLRKNMRFELVKQLNPIGAMKTFTKPNCNLCMEEHLTILKNLREKTRHNYEQEFGDIWGLPAQDLFPHILPKQ